MQEKSEEQITDQIRVILHSRQVIIGICSFTNADVQIDEMEAEDEVAVFARED